MLVSRDAAYYNRGVALFEKHDYDAEAKEFIKDERGYDEAIKDFDEAIRRDPTNAIFYCNRGKAWLAKMEQGKATKDFEEASRLDPTIDTRSRSTLDLHHIQGLGVLAKVMGAGGLNLSTTAANFLESYGIFRIRDLVVRTAPEIDEIHIDVQRLGSQ